MGAQLAPPGAALAPGAKPLVTQMVFSELDLHKLTVKRLAPVRC